MKKTNIKLTIHPFLFAIFPVLFLYSHNVNEAYFSDTLLPTIFILGLTYLFLLLFYIILKDKLKTGTIISIYLILFFSYGSIFNLIFRIGMEHFRHRYLLFVWLLLFILTFLIIKKSKSNLSAFNRFLNITSVILILIPLFNILTYKIKSREDYAFNNKRVNIKEIFTSNSEKKSNSPDIYYIIWDRYAGADSLKYFYNFDNSEFINYLTDKGFYVASKSNANYLKTGHSLASSLNIEYINYLSDIVGKESNNWQPLFAMLQNYKVLRFLKSRGYKSIHLGSWWPPTSKNIYADINYNYHLLPNFSMALIELTMFQSLEVRIGRFIQKKRVLYKLDKLSEIPDISGPKFVFAHMLIPHPDYIFDRNGRFLSYDETNKRTEKENYINQLVFVNNKIKEMIDTILIKSRIPPIIILQSDEGPFPERYDKDKANFKWKQATVEELHQKMGILNAYYLPKVENKNLYPSITPVNTFRLIFNLYFNKNFDLLPDRIYIFEDECHIYNLFDITDKMSAQE